MSGEPDCEVELIRRAKTGDLAAFCSLVQDRQQRLFACALMLCGDRQRAEDLTQETLVSAWRSLSRFDARCQFSTWLYGILYNHLRKGRRFRNISSLDERSAEKLQVVSAASESAVERQEDLSQIRSAVAALSPEHRQVIELRFFAGASLGEIAALLGCPLGTVKSRLHHGLEKLRRMRFLMDLVSSRGTQP